MTWDNIHYLVTIYVDKSWAQKCKKKIRDDLSNICNFDVYYFYFSAKTGKGSAEIKNYLVEIENLPLEIFSKD